MSTEFTRSYHSVLGSFLRMAAYGADAVNTCNSETIDAFAKELFFVADEIDKTNTSEKGTIRSATPPRTHLKED